MTPTPKMIEAAARAIAVSMDTDPDNDAFDGIPMWSKFVPEAEAAIKAAFAAMRRPISEAPKDGTRVLVKKTTGRVCVGQYVDGEWEGEDGYCIHDPAFISAFIPLSIFEDSK